MHGFPALSPTTTKKKNLPSVSTSPVSLGTKAINTADRYQAKVVNPRLLLGSTTTPFAVITRRRVLSGRQASAFSALWEIPPRKINKKLKVQGSVVFRRVELLLNSSQRHSGKLVLEVAARMRVQVQD
ncbi:hypothetical protein PABG_11907 [Paracoccidioides brasiliensis Pb03]|nr:hypothetical protein PABG_11907 [Paracoccidioides brasiliensis Pb03]